MPVLGTGIHVLESPEKTWMPGLRSTTFARMTLWKRGDYQWQVDPIMLRQSAIHAF
jgi:hypothetical protein